MELGIEDVTRETFHSSVRMTRQLLERLGFQPAEAKERVQRFVEHDEAMLREQYLVHDNEEALIQSVQQARAQLDALFEADALLARKAEKAQRGAAG